MSCSDWGTKSQYSTLAGSSREVISHTFGTKEETVTGTYTAPNDEMAWFIQGSLEFADATDVDVSFFSIKRTQTSDVTEEFPDRAERKDRTRPEESSRVSRRRSSRSVRWTSPIRKAIIRLKASIKGNHYGMANLIYRGPVLMGRNARYKVNAVDGNTFDITLTTKLSGFENVFKMFPFSTKYGGVDVETTDGAGEHHVSTNKNQWITSDLATGLKRLRIRYPT